jgi:plasmid stabilization system protein ParE
MARIQLAAGVLDDLDRFLEHLARLEVPDGPARINGLLAAIDILRHSPLIGRPVRAGRRELIVGQGGRGYMVLYRHVAAVDTVFVLAIRSQREDAYKR